MDPSILLTYGWVIIVLALLEGLLAADNAIVMAVMVKHLPVEQRKKALFYGLLGAFVFRFISLFLISYLANIWQIQALGAAYLLFMSAKNLYNIRTSDDAQDKEEYETEATVSKSSFWMTVLKVEFADIAFAIDSMLAAVAIALTVPKIGTTFGGMDAGQFAVMFIGGMIGVIMMRFAATWFVRLLKKYPGLEVSAFLIVGWVGIKLVVIVLSHPKIALFNEHFPESALWQTIFWSVLLLLLVGGWLSSIKKSK